MSRLCSMWAIIVIVMALPFAGAEASSLLSLNKPVSGSGYLNHGSTEIFPYHNITDGFFNDTNDIEPYPNLWSFWVTSNASKGYATIDLEAIYDLDYFKIQNTHNRYNNDRATTKFHIEVSTDNVHFTSVVSGTMAVSFADPIPWETYDIASVNARYVKFFIDGYAGYSGGINELEVYGNPAGVVPLPGALLLLGSGLVGLIGIRRKLS
jgi:hypothetical protein